MKGTAKPAKSDRIKVFDGAPGNLLRVANQITTAIFTRHINRFGVTPVQCCVLEALQERPGLDASALGKLIAVDQATLASVLQRLTARGLVARGPREGDRRVKELRVTPEGSALLDDIHAEVRKVKREILAPLDVEERKQFISVLETFIARHGQD